MSTTVTVAMQVEMLPLTSVTVSVILFAPTLEQLKLLFEIVVLAIPQLSEDPLFICDAVMVALPEAFRLIVMF